MNAKVIPRETPDLNDVALFVQVVRAASFSIAAREHGVPVSTVSRRVARLEARLGTRLLERTTRRLRLTDVGGRYFEHAERALDELTEGNRHVRALHAVPRGRVRITAPVGVGPRLASAIAPYLLATPLVSIEIDLTERRVDILGEGFDIAIRAGALDDGDFVARKLFDATRGLFASKAYLARRGRPKRLADLASHDLVATRASPNGATWDLVVDPDDAGRGRRHRFAFKPRLVVNELLAARHAAIAGAGVTLLPTAQVEPGTLERVLPKIAGEPGGLWLLYPAQRRLTAAARSCIEHLLSTIPAGFSASKSAG
ncbi:MAG: LysR family transcriptional regulator [Labilithrix sp.]|nr:LysR family transcriptional regulator [Labilithrix sp.]